MNSLIEEKSYSCQEDGIVNQAGFLSALKAGLEKKLSRELYWGGGQKKSNTAPFSEPNKETRRDGRFKKREEFELGDRVSEINGWRVVFEYESGPVLMSNLVKYWPYLRGELDITPKLLVICSFSDWNSYATWRDLWEWTLCEIKTDNRRLTPIEGRQFDHWPKDPEKRKTSLCAAIDWLLELTSNPPIS